MRAAGVRYPDSLLEWVTGTEISKLILKPLPQAAVNEAPKPSPSPDIKAAKIDTKEWRTEKPEKKTEGPAKTEIKKPLKSKKSTNDTLNLNPSRGRNFTLQFSEIDYDPISSSSEGYSSRTTTIKIVRKKRSKDLKPALTSKKEKPQKRDQGLNVGLTAAESRRRSCLKPSSDIKETRPTGEKQGNRCVDALTRENTLKNRGIRAEYLEIRSPLVGQRLGGVIGREVPESQYITHDRSQRQQSHQHSSHTYQKQFQAQNQHSTQDSGRRRGKLDNNYRNPVSIGTRDGQRSSGHLDSAHPNQGTNQSTQRNSNDAQRIHHQPNSKQTLPNFAFRYLIMQGQSPQIIQPVKAEVIMREDVIEGPSDPRPNAFYCAKTGVLRVYHGPQYGNPYATIIPHPPMPIGTYPPHAGQFMTEPTQIPGGPPPMQTAMPTSGLQYHAQPHGSSTMNPQPMNFNANNNQRKSSGSNVHFNSPQGGSQPQAAPGTPNNGWQTLTQEEADNMMQGAMPGGWVNDGPSDNDSSNIDCSFGGNGDINNSGSGWNDGNNNETSGNDNSDSGWNDDNNQNSGNNNSGSGWNDNNQNPGNSNGMSPAVQSNAGVKTSNLSNNASLSQNAGGNNSNSNFNKSPSGQNNSNGNNPNTKNGPGNSPATSWQNNSGNNNQNFNSQPHNSPAWLNQGGNNNNQNSSNRNTPRQNNCAQAKPWRNGNSNNQSSRGNQNSWNRGDQDCNDSFNNNNTAGGGWNNESGQNNCNGNSGSGWNNESNGINGNNNSGNHNNNNNCNSGSGWGNDASNIDTSGGDWNNEFNGNSNNSGDNLNNSLGNNDDNNSGGWNNNSSNDNNNSGVSWNNNSSNNNNNGGNNNSDERWGALETPAAWGDMSAAQGGSNNNSAKKLGGSGRNNNSSGSGWNNNIDNSHGRVNSFSMGASKDKPWQTETVISAGSWGDGGTGPILPTGTGFNNSKNSGGW